MLKSRLERFALAMFLLICLILALPACSKKPKPAIDIQKLTGVVVLFANHDIQEYVFISEKGGRLLRSKDECDKDASCQQMTAALIDAKKADMVDLGNCPSVRENPPL